MKKVRIGFMKKEDIIKLFSLRFQLLLLMS